MTGTFAFPRLRPPPSPPLAFPSLGRPLTTLWGLPLSTFGLWDRSTVAGPLCCQPGSPAPQPALCIIRRFNIVSQSTISQVVSLLLVIIIALLLHLHLTPNPSFPLPPLLSIHCHSRLVVSLLAQTLFDKSTSSPSRQDISIQLARLS